MPTMKDLIQASELMDEGKEDVELTSRKYRFGFENDPTVGRTCFWLSPISLFEAERLYFSPYSYNQFCNKILVYPAKALSTDLVTPAIISAVAEERQRRMRERKLIARIKRTRLTDGSLGKILLRGFVRPNRPGLKTTNVLKAIAKHENGYHIETSGPVRFEDQLFNRIFSLGESISLDTQLGEQEGYVAIRVMNSEVGALKGGLKIESLLRVDTSVMVMEQGLFILDADHYEQRNLEEAVEEILDEIHRGLFAMSNIYQNAWNSMDCEYEDLDDLKKHLRLIGATPEVIENAASLCEIETPTTPLSRGLLAFTLGRMSQGNDRNLEVLAGRILS